MWQMKEWFFKVVVQLVWGRRKGVYYAVSVVSIVGNLVVLVGPSVQASIVLRSGALQAAWSALPQVADVVLHRSMLYFLLNLIVVRIVVKSGVLGQMPRMPVKPDESCSPTSYYVVRDLPWPVYNSYTVHGTLSASGAPMFTDTSMWLQQACSDDQNNAIVDVCPQTPALRLQHPSINKSYDDVKPKCARAPSLFTIEPLDELVQTTEGYRQNDDQAHIDKTLKHPLRKVVSRRADLHSSMETCAGTTKDFMKAELPQQKNEEAMQLVLANAAAEHEDNRLSRQEFNDRVDSFICKFKRSLTMQRQDSFNRLFGLGGGHIRLIK